MSDKLWILYILLGVCLLLGVGTSLTYLGMFRGVMWGL